MLMEVYEEDVELRYRTFDAETGAPISSGIIAETGNQTAHEILVDSNAETTAGVIHDFVVCVNMHDAANLAPCIKTYHTDDEAQTWTETATIDMGPAGDPEYVHGMDMTFAVDGYPYFHIAYEKECGVWHTCSMDGGRTWNPSALTPIQSTHEAPQVGLGGYGTHTLIAASNADVDTGLNHSEPAEMHDLALRQIRQPPGRRRDEQAWGRLLRRILALGPCGLFVCPV